MTEAFRFTSEESGEEIVVDLGPDEVYYVYRRTAPGKSLTFWFDHEYYDESVMRDAIEDKLREERAAKVRQGIG